MTTIAPPAAGRPHRRLLPPAPFFRPAQPATAPGTPYALGCAPPPTVYTTLPEQIAKNYPEKPHKK
ncbi:MAG: hypothetical protein U0350_38230 [Caldilineaceae bacterium]